MRLLALETAGEACSAALCIDGEVREDWQLAPRQHSKIILPMVDGLLANAGIAPQQLDCVAFSRGPGSFTGVRIATSVSQAIAFAVDIPVVPVSTLAALAHDYFKTATADIAYIAVDARMSEIYWAVYQKSQRLAPEIISAIADLPVPKQPGVGIGSGWNIYREELSAHLGGALQEITNHHLLHASAVADLALLGLANGEAVPAELALPVYLRDKVAKTTVERNKPK